MRQLEIRFLLSSIFGVGVVGFLCLAVPSMATIHRVPDAFPTIQMAILFSADDDTVLVDPGTYNEAINFLGRNILVGSRALVPGMAGHLSFMDFLVNLGPLAVICLGVSLLYLRLFGEREFFSSPPEAKSS